MVDGTTFTLEPSSNIIRQSVVATTISEALVSSKRHQWGKNTISSVSVNVRYERQRTANDDVSIDRLCCVFVFVYVCLCV